MARHDAISQEGDSKIKELLLAGYSQSLVARITGVHERSVGTRRAELKRAGAEFPKCGCGRSVSHTGRCSHRVKTFRETPPTTFSRGRTERVLNLGTDAHGPHQRRIARLLPPPTNCSPAQMVAFVEKAIPEKCHPGIRNDLVQDVLVAILAGEIKMDGIGAALPRFIRSLYELFPAVGGPISLDDFSVGGGNRPYERKRTLAEIVPDESLGPADLFELSFEEEDDDGTLEYISNLHALEIGGGAGRFQKRFVHS